MEKRFHINVVSSEDGKMINNLNEICISIIVPVFNVEEYLEKCIDSLQKQTHENLEIILIDDGSTDRSGSICDKYSTNDSRITVVHQENQGVSHARNVGMKKASGKYLMFVDSDDIIERNMCESLLSTIMHYNADIVLSNFVEDRDNEKVKDANVHGTEILNKNSIMYKITDIKYKSGIFVTTKLISSKIAKLHRFKEGVPLGEDQLFVFALLNDCDRVCVMNKGYYHYIARQGSAMRQQLDLDKEKKLISVYNHILDLTKSNYNKKIYRRCISFRICHCELTIANKMIQSDFIDEQLLEDLRKFVRNNIWNVLISKFYLWKKMQIFIFAYSFSVYKKMLEIKGAI